MNTIETRPMAPSGLIREVARVQNMLEAAGNTVGPETTVDELVHLVHEAQLMLRTALGREQIPMNAMPILTINEAAARLGATVAQVRKAVYLGRIQAVKTPVSGWWGIATAEVERCVADRSWLHPRGRPFGTRKAGTPRQ
jgi:hypothetical protein